MNKTSKVTGAELELICTRAVQELANAGKVGLIGDHVVFYGKDTVRRIGSTSDTNTALMRQLYMTYPQACEPTSKGKTTIVSI